MLGAVILTIVTLFQCCKGEYVSVFAEGSSGSRFGRSVSRFFSVGDFLGVVVGTSSENHVYYMTIAPGTSPIEFNTTQIPSPSVNESTMFGLGVCVTDLDGDGEVDILVGAPLDSANGIQGGRMHIGRSVANFSEWSPPIHPTGVEYVGGEYFGTSISHNWIDLDGDESTIEGVVGAVALEEWTGGFFVVSIRRTDLSRAGMFQFTAGRRGIGVGIAGFAVGETWGFAVEVWNGYVVVGTPNIPANAFYGGIALITLNATSMMALSMTKITAATLTDTFVASDWFGVAFGSCDVDRDGKEEFLIGATGVGDREGEIWVLNDTQLVMRIGKGEAESEFGSAIGNCADLDGDGVANEVLVGAKALDKVYIATIPCPPGMEDRGNGLCEECNPGWYWVDDSCARCPDGMISTSPGATQCHPCPRGTVPANESTICAPCPPNSFSQRGASYCYKSCPAGEFLNATKCSPCPLGTASSSPNLPPNATCQICPQGTYSSTPGAVTCSLCPPGRFSLSYGAVANSTCQSCPEGFTTKTFGTILSTSCTLLSPSLPPPQPLSTYPDIPIAAKQDLGSIVVQVPEYNHSEDFWIAMFGDDIVAVRVSVQKFDKVEEICRGCKVEEEWWSDGDGRWERLNGVRGVVDHKTTHPLTITLPLPLSIPLSYNISITASHRLSPSLLSPNAPTTTNLTLNPSHLPILPKTLLPGGGASHTCVVYLTGDLSCFGTGSSMQLGHGELVDSIGDDEEPASLGLVNVTNGSVGVGGLGGDATFVVVNESNLVGWGVGVGLDSSGSRMKVFNLGLEERRIVGLSAFTSVSGHVCMLLEDGFVKCVGSGTVGQLGLGPSITSRTFQDVGYTPLPSKAIDVVVGGYHTLVLLEDSTLWVFGWGSYGQLGLGNGGDDVFSPQQVQLPKGAQSIGAGLAHSCVLLVNGRVTCWGYGAKGRLGYGDEVNRGLTETPVDYATISISKNMKEHKAIQLAVGEHHSCVLLHPSNRVRCWGDGGNGRLGYGDEEDIGDDELPSDRESVDVGGVVVELRAYRSSTCVLLVDAIIRCWGSEASNGAASRMSLGVSPATMPATFYTPSTPTIPLFSTKTGILSPHPILSKPLRTSVFLNSASKLVHPIKQVSCNSAFTCVLLDNGRVRCFGSGLFGRLGYGNVEDVNDASQAKDVDIGDDVIAIAAGGIHTCALLQDGNVRCWGHSSELGIGTSATSYGSSLDNLPSSAPFVDLGGDVVTSISAGDGHTCVIVKGGKLRCWGDGTFGKLGYGNVESVGDDEPVESMGYVDTGGTVVQVSAGLHHTCAVLEGGLVSCWGRGENGRLGYGNEENVGDDEVPASAGCVDVGGEAVKVVAGESISCVLLRGGHVRCWGECGGGNCGYDTVVDLGDDEVPASLDVVQVGGAVQDIDVGTEACVLLLGGEMKCFGEKGEEGGGGGWGSSWGSDDSASDDDPFKFYPDLPMYKEGEEVGGVVTEICVTSGHKCAVLESGEMKCFGLTSRIGIENAESLYGSVVEAEEVPLLQVATISTSIQTLSLSNLYGINLFYPQTPLLLQPNSFIPSFTNFSIISIPSFSSPIPAILSLDPNNFLLETVPPSTILNTCQLPSLTLIAASSLCLLPATSNSLTPSTINFFTSPTLPTLGGAVMEFEGEFGMLVASGGVKEVRVGDEECGSVVFAKSLTRFTCLSPPGIGANHAIKIIPKFEPALPTHPSFTISYTKPTLTSISPPIGVSVSGGEELTIAGRNFGSLEDEITVIVGDKECGGVTLEQSDVVTCTAPSGVGVRPVQVVVGNQSSTNSIDVASAFPRITSITPSHTLLGEVVTMVVDGSDFGLERSDFDLVEFAGEPCQSPTPTSATPSSSSFTCTLNTSELVAVWPSTFSYVTVHVSGFSTGVLSGLWEGVGEPRVDEIVVVAEGVVRLLGSGFGLEEDDVKNVHFFLSSSTKPIPSPSWRWNSGSNILAHLPPITGQVGVEVVSRVGRRSSRVFFASTSPMIATIQPSYVLSGELIPNVTIRGQHLALLPSDIDHVFLGGVACTAPFNVTIPGSEFTCSLNTSTLVTWPDPTAASVSIGGITTGTLREHFEGFEVPSIAATSPLSSLPTSGGGKVRVVGRGFGKEEKDVAGVWVDGGRWAEVMWVSGIEVEVILPPGAGDVELQVVSRAGVYSNKVTVTYSSPAVSQVVPSFLLATTAASMEPASFTLLGTNFPPPSSPPSSHKIILGSLNCIDPVYHSTEEMSCTITNSTSVATSATSTASSITFSTSSTTSPIPILGFTAIAPPVLNKRCIPSGYVSGARVRVYGKNFARTANDGTLVSLVDGVRVSGSECAEVEVLSDRILECVLPRLEREWVLVEVEGFGVGVGGGSGVCNVSTPITSILPWRVSRVHGWRRVGDPTHVQLTWNASRGGELGSDGEWIVEVQSEEDGTWDAELRVSVGGQKVGRATITVAETPIRVRVYGLSSIFKTNPSTPTPLIYSSCDRGNFLLDADAAAWKHRVCQTCLIGGVCDRLATASTIRQAAGFWRTDVDKESWGDASGITFARCLTEEVCIEEKQNRSSLSSTFTSTSSLSSSSVCAKGHTGTLCHQCVPTYYRTSGGECLECGGVGAAVGVFVGFTVVSLLILSAYLVHVMNKMELFIAGMLDDKHNIDIIRIVLIHFQRVAIVLRSVPIRWPSGSSTFINPLPSIALPGFSDSLQCLFSTSSIPSSTTVILLAVIRAVGIPIIAVLFVALFWAIFPFIRNLCCTCASTTSSSTPTSSLLNGVRPSFVRQGSLWRLEMTGWDWWKRRMTTSLLILVTLLHRPISEAGMGLLACIHIQPIQVPLGIKGGGSWRLLFDTDEACVDGPRWGVAAAILTIGSLIPPIAIFITLFYHRSDILSLTPPRGDPWYRIHLFLFRDFRRNFYFWGAIEMVFTLILLASTVFTASAGISAQFLAAAAAVLLEVAALGWFKPHSASFLDAFAFATAIVAVLTFLGGVGVQLGGGDGVGGVVVALNILVILTAIGIAGRNVRPWQWKCKCMRKKQRRKKEERKVGEFAVSNPMREKEKEKKKEEEEEKEKEKDGGKGVGGMK